MIKAYLLNGGDVGKKITVSTAEYTVSGDLSLVLHTPGLFGKGIRTNIEIALPGGVGKTSLNLEKDQDVVLG